MTNKEKYAYIAGIVDGEGCLCIEKYTRNNSNAYVACLTVANSRICLINWLNKQIPAEIIERHYTKKNWNTGYTYRLRKVESLKLLLVNILPYLLIKSTQAELLLELIKITPVSGKHTNDIIKKRKEEIFQEIHRLNKSKEVS